MCFSRSEIERILSAAGSSVEQAELRRHAQSCSSCHQVLSDVARRMLLEKISGPFAHLESVELSLYLDHEPQPDDASLIKEHLDTCTTCRSRLEQMQKEREASLTAPTVAFTYRPPSQAAAVQLPKRFWIPQWAFASGAIAAMVLIVTVVGVRLMRPAMMLQDGKVRIANEKTGLRISGVPGQFEAMVGEKLPPGGEPQLLAPLTPVPKTLGPDSDSKALVIGVKRPFPDEVFAEPPVEIQWISPRSGDAYRIRIYQEGAEQKPFWEQATSATSATVSLKPGAAYVVVISGEQGTHAIYSPAIRFRVLDEGEVSAMRELLATAGDSHLLKGIYYEKHGLFTKALDEYSALQKSNPRSPLARRIFTELSQALTPP